MFEDLVARTVVSWWQKPEWLAFWVTVAGVIVGGLTLGCVIRQLKLEGRQTDLAEQTKSLAQEQTRLAQRQTEIIEQQRAILARRAELGMSVRQAGRLIEFRAHNQGPASARDFHWHLFVPNDLMGQLANHSWNGQSAPTEETEIDGKKCRRFTGFIGAPLYPGLDTYVGRIELPHSDHLRTLPPVLWKLNAEDGEFPNLLSYGKLELKPQ